MSSYHDGNHTHTLLAIESDGSTLVNVTADETTHALNITTGGVNVDNGPTESRHDGNSVPILFATSNADGETPVAIYADASGYLLVNQT